MATTAQVSNSYAVWRRFERTFGPFLRVTCLYILPNFIGLIAWWMLFTRIGQLHDVSYSLEGTLAAVFGVATFVGFVVGATNIDLNPPIVPVVNGWIGGGMISLMLLVALALPPSTLVKEGTVHVDRAGSVWYAGDRGPRAGLFWPSREVIDLNSVHKLTLPARRDRTLTTRVPVAMQTTVSYVIRYRTGPAFEAAVRKAQYELEDESLQSALARTVFRSVPETMARTRAEPERFVRRYFRSPLTYVDRIEVSQVRSKPYDPDD